MAKHKAYQSAQLPSGGSGGSGSSIIAAPISLGQILTQNQLPTTYTDPGTGEKIDFSNMTLSNVGGAGFSNGTQIWQAIVNLRYQYPALASVITSKMGISTQTKPTTVQLDNLFGMVKAANGNWNGVTSVGEYSTKAQLATSEAALASGTAAAITSATASQEANAFDNISTTIDDWYPGTSAQDMKVKNFLNGVIANLVTLNGDHLVNHNSLLDVLRGNTKAAGMSESTFKQLQADYDQAFPGLRKYNSDDTQVHMSETQYQTYTQSIMNSATQYGAPMPTAVQIGDLLNHHVSATEFQQRVVDVYTSIQNADQNTKNIMQQQYGVNESDLMQYVVNGNLPTMQRQVASAQIQDYAQQVGLGGITSAGSSQLADMARLASTAGNSPLGVGVSQIKSSLLNASKDVELTKAAPGQAAPTISTTDLIGSQIAGYGGTSQVAAARNVQMAEEAHGAAFERGGGYAEDSKGVVGLGSART